MSKETNIIESVEFLAPADLLVSELDKRLSFSALTEVDRACNGFGGICTCFGKQLEPRPCNNLASAVRG